MANRFRKLSDVELVSTASNPNVLIEEDGEICKIPASMLGGGSSVQSDWKETDPTSPAYIKNKPSGGGGSAVFNLSSGYISGLTYELLEKLLSEGTTIILNEYGAYRFPHYISFNSGIATIYYITSTTTGTCYISSSDVR